MAAIMKKSNHLQNQYQNAKNRAILFGILTALLFIGFGLTSHINVVTFGALGSLPFLFPALYLASGFMAIRFYSKAAALKSGIDGEATTAELVSALPEGFTGYQNLHITYEGQTSELDMVVVGPTGVFVIETKNLNGTVTGVYRNKQWVQHKVGRQGTPYSKNFLNPAMQAATQVHRLANFLRSNNCNVFVNSLVYFSNPATIVQISGEPGVTPVFAASTHSDDQIRSHILAGRPISEDLCNAINNLLSRC